MLLLGSVQAGDPINWPLTPRDVYSFWKHMQLPGYDRSLAWTLKVASVPSRRACAFVMRGLRGFIYTGLLLVLSFYSEASMNSELRPLLQLFFETHVYDLIALIPGTDHSRARLDHDCEETAWSRVACIVDSVFVHFTHRSPRKFRYPLFLQCIQLFFQNFVWF